MRVPTALQLRKRADRLIHDTRELLERSEERRTVMLDFRTRRRDAAHSDLPELAREFRAVVDQWRFEDSVREWQSAPGTK